MGYDTLEATSGGENEEKVDDKNVEEQKKSLWKQLSGLIGQDVTSLISLPVWVFDPISFLQIMCEPMMYAELLHKASESSDQYHRMGYLCAWIASGYSCAIRLKKPFNPLLGETFEFIPPDGRWKFFAEQVSHHPPIGISDVFNEKFQLHLEMELKSKFRGNSTEVTVNGSNHFWVTKFNDHFVWNHFDTCAHNIIVGGMWVDHYGELEVKNHTTGDVAYLKATKCGWLGAGRYEISGEIKDKNGVVRLKLNGKWNDSVNAIKIKNGVEGNPIVLWKKPAKPILNKWLWPKFTEDLSTWDKDYEAILPPTDSRLRADRWALQRDDLDLAGKEKHRLEEEQRTKRKERELSGAVYEPKYYKKVQDPVSGERWEYAGKYWEEREERIQKYRASQAAKSEKILEGVAELKIQDDATGQST